MSLVENLYNPIINALGWTLVHSLWQILAIALVWRFFIYLFRTGSASSRYNVSLLAIVTIPLLSIYTFAKQFNIYNQATKLVSVELDSGLKIPTETGAPLFFVEKNHGTIFYYLEGMTQHLVWIYLAGVVIFSIVGLASYFRTMYLTKRETSPLPLEWQERVRLITKKIGLKRKPGVLQSKRVLSPAVIGFFKPVVLLPLAMLGSLTTHQVEAIIYHELYHIKRYDHFVNLIQHIIETLFFFHPATWWMSNRLRMEREICIDELVVDKTTDPLVYANALMKLEETKINLLQPLLAATRTKSHLLTRIKKIMTMKTKTFNPTQRIAAFALIIAVAASLAWIIPAHDLDKDYETTDTKKVESFVSSIAKEIDSAQSNRESNDETQTKAQSGNEPGKPDKVVLQNGHSIQWEQLSEEDRNKITAEINEAMKELKEFFGGEFKEEMKKVGQEVREAVKSATSELENLNMESIGEEIKAARQQVEKAMKEVRIQLDNQDFLFKNTENLFNEIDWEQFGDEMKKTMSGLSEELQKIGPTINESLKDLNLGELLKEVFDSLEKSLPKTTKENNQ